MQRRRLVIHEVMAGGIVVVVSVLASSAWPLLALPGVLTVVAIRHFSQLECPSCRQRFYVADGDVRFTAERCVHCGSDSPTEPWR